MVTAVDDLLTPGTPATATTKSHGAAIREWADWKFYAGSITAGERAFANRIADDLDAGV